PILQPTGAGPATNEAWPICRMPRPIGSRRHVGLPTPAPGNGTQQRTSGGDAASVTDRRLPRRELPRLVDQRNQPVRVWREQTGFGAGFLGDAIEIGLRLRYLRLERLRQQ